MTHAVRHSRQIILPKCWNLTPKDAQRIVDTLGIQGLTFITLPRRSARSLFSSPARRSHSASGRFLAGERGSFTLTPRPGILEITPSL